MKVIIEQDHKKVTVELGEELTAFELLEEITQLMTGVGFMESSVNDAVLELAENVEYYKNWKE